MYLWKVCVGWYQYLVAGVQIVEKAEELALRMHKQRFPDTIAAKVTGSFELEQIDFRTAVWIDRR